MVSSVVVPSSQVPEYVLRQAVWMTADSDGVPSCPGVSSATLF
jgi:hypothetical protein